MGCVVVRVVAPGLSVLMVVVLVVAVADETGISGGG